MFNLDQAIADWRRPMLAAGIKTPVPLDELECHLREEIEQQMRSGLSAQQAFEVAARGIGGANVLKAEFVKIKGSWGILKHNKSAITNRVLALLWLTGCSWSLSTVCRQFIYSEGTWLGTALSWMSMLAIQIYVVGIIGSICLFCGANLGRSIVRMLALLMAVVCTAQILNFRVPGEWRVWCGVVTVFSLVSIWLLHAPKDPDLNPNTATK
jgi:hypothetical protein